MAKVNDSKSPLQQLCYVLMGSLFGLSTCFQFNDPDWYFWIPLYAAACSVNSVNGLKLKVNKSSIRKMAEIALLLGIILFIKVSVAGEEGFWSANMRERSVREKLGSGLVICSMFMHLLENSSSNPFRRVTEYGTPILVAAAYGLSFIFFAFQHEDMR